MCARYYIDPEDRPQEVQAVIDALNRRSTPTELKLAGEIFPTDVAPVLANSRSMEIKPFAMRWGYSFPGGKPIINARSETAAEKPLFKDGMKQRRCLIPASNYFEWGSPDGRRMKYAIRPRGARFLYLAGIYHLEHHEGATIPAFTILTRDAADSVAAIHPRMPIILPHDAVPAWLDSEVSARALLHRALSDMEYAPA